jgi:hypothetical protein
VVLDRDFFVRVACACTLYYRPGLVAGFRTHATSKSVSERRHWVTEVPAMYRELFERPDLPPRLRRFRRESMSRAHLEAAWCALHANQPALGSLLRSVLCTCSPCPVWRAAPVACDIGACDDVIETVTPGAVSVRR